MARTKDSTTTQLLKGVDKKNPDRVNRNEPQTGDLKDVPEFLTDKEKFWWNEAIKRTANGIIQNGDYFSMIMLARDMARYVDSPDTFVVSDRQHLKSLFASFGMTPDSRRNFTIQKEEKKVNPFELL